MAYSKTTWETGDTITAELLNHAEQGIYDASAKELPDVDSEDNGKVLTVAEGEWSAENLPADNDVYVLTGTVTVDADMDFVSFTLDDGDISVVDQYKTAVLKCTLKMGNTVLMTADVPYQRRILFNTTTMQAIDTKVFLTYIPTLKSAGYYQILTEVEIIYNTAGNSWVCDLRKYKILEPSETT